MKLLKIATGLCFVLANNINAQITTSTLTVQQYVQNVLLGPGVTASNITYTGLAKGVASFTAPTSTNLGITKGVYLTSGSNGTILGEQGPNGPSLGIQSIDQGQPGDADLDILASATTNDAAVLEFDFIPQSDTVKFRYVFASEEYNEYVNSMFNDPFAFILSGVTTPLPPVNIALIPGTSTPITINNVNNGNSSGASSGPCTNCAYYRDNVAGTINSVYDGLTTVLTAKMKVVCGEKYHIKIAVADASDGSLDSGVFLEAGSFSSIPPISISTSNSALNFTDSVMVEDCNLNCIFFVRNANLSQKDSFQLQVGGNAILGSDYIQQGNTSFTWPSKLVYSANQDTIVICNLEALQDNLPEGIDTIAFTLTSFTTSSTACANANTVKFNLYVKDYNPITIGQKDTILCNSLLVTLNADANFGVPAYTYTWSSPSGNSSTYNAGPITQPTTFTITVNDFCNKPVTKQILVTPTTTYLASFTNSVMVEDCNSNCVYFVRNINLSQKDSFQLQVGGNATLGSDYIQQGNTSFAWPSKFVYSVNQDSIVVCNLKALQDNLPEGIDTIAFTLTNFTTSSTACSNTVKFNLYIKDYNPITIGQKDTALCNGLSVNLNANANFGAPAYTYTWSSPLGNSPIYNTGPMTQPTTFTITVNDFCNKPVTKQILVTPTTLPVLTQVGPYKFCLDSSKQVPIMITGGRPSYAINWQIPSGGIVPYDTINNIYFLKQSDSPSNGIYSVIVTDQCNKKDTINIDISVVDCNIIVPNVVTPNGDNVNEFFKVHGLENFPGSSLVVFNRWGNKIYMSDNYANDWKPNVNPGTYFYLINIPDGRKFNGFFQVFKD